MECDKCNKLLNINGLNRVKGKILCKKCLPNIINFKSQKFKVKKGVTVTLCLTEQKMKLFEERVKRLKINKSTYIRFLVFRDLKNLHEITKTHTQEMKGGKKKNGRRTFE